ncbi:hypothetical protein ACA910_015970 [Epithemia clementina (nom. ined.)]
MASTTTTTTRTPTGTFNRGFDITRDEAEELLHFFEQKYADEIPIPMIPVDPRSIPQNGDHKTIPMDPLSIQPNSDKQKNESQGLENDSRVSSQTNDSDNQQVATAAMAASEDKRLQPHEHQQKQPQRQEEQPSFMPPRNKALADVIRQGLDGLNHAASKIQSASGTKRSLFVVQQDHKFAVQRQVKQSFLFKAAQESLQVVARDKGALTMDGEPIMILDVQVKKGNSKHAVVYWCLPLHVLVSQDYSKLDKQYFEFRMHQHITKKGGQRALQLQMHSMMSQVYGFPPSIRMEPATDDQIIEVLRMTSSSTPAEAAEEKRIQMQQDDLREALLKQFKEKEEEDKKADKEMMDWFK